MGPCAPGSNNVCQWDLIVLAPVLVEVCGEERKELSRGRPAHLAAFLLHPVVGVLELAIVHGDREVIRLAVRVVHHDLDGVLRVFLVRLPGRAALLAPALALALLRPCRAIGHGPDVELEIVPGYHDVGQLAVRVARHGPVEVLLGPSVNVEDVNVVPEFAPVETTKFGLPLM